HCVSPSNDLFILTPQDHLLSFSHPTHHHPHRAPPDQVEHRHQRRHRHRHRRPRHRQHPDRRRPRPGLDLLPPRHPRRRSLHRNGHISNPAARTDQPRTDRPRTPGPQHHPPGDPTEAHTPRTPPTGRGPRRRLIEPPP